jgi:hypothetical protein
MPTTNTLIGIPIVLMIPAFLLWAALSWRVWRQNGGRIDPADYRMVVTIFLFVTAINVADFARVRFNVSIWTFAPERVSWWIVAFRWAWAASVWWGTIVLYGRLLPRLWRRVRSSRVRRPPDGDPYLTGAPPASVSPLPKGPDRERMTYLNSRLRQISDDLNGIVTRIERDEHPLLPRPYRRDH